MSSLNRNFREIITYYTIIMQCFVQELKSRDKKDNSKKTPKKNEKVNSFSHIKVSFNKKFNKKWL
jgi:hypothetical protein